MICNKCKQEEMVYSTNQRGKRRSVKECGCGCSENILF